MAPVDSSFLIQEDFAIYREKSKQFMSSHQLADFRKCPALWRRKNEGIIPAVKSESFSFGSAAHTLILEGKQKFENDFAVGGPINPKTGKEYGADTAAYSEWLFKQSKPQAVTTADAKKLEIMRASVLMHKDASKILSGGMAERVCRSTVNGVESQARIDWFNTNGISDLKTCADLSYFEEDIKRYGYLHQMAFYVQVLVQHMTSVFTLPAHLIAVEKNEPYRTGVFKISEDALRECASENAAALARFKQCKEANYFPTDFEDIRFITS